MIDVCSDEASSVVPIWILGKINLLYKNEDVQQTEYCFDVTSKSMSNDVKVFSSIDIERGRVVYH